MKAAEQILEEFWPNRPWPNGLKTDAMILKVMKLYANQNLNDTSENKTKSLEKKHFNKGDRVIITKCDEFQKEKYKYDVGFTGTIKENKSENPFVFFDKKEANYTLLGTAIPDGDFEFIID